MASIWHVYIYMNSWHLESHKLPRATDTQKLWLNFFGSYSRVAFRSSTPDIQLFAMENHQCNRCTVDGNQKSGEKTPVWMPKKTRTVNSGEFNYLSLNLWPSDFWTINRMWIPHVPWLTGPTEICSRLLLNCSRFCSHTYYGYIYVTTLRISRDPEPNPARQSRVSHPSFWDGSIADS